MRINRTLLGRFHKKPTTLSEKTITTKIRKYLRSIYGPRNVIVSCKAYLNNGRWIGKCKVNGVQYTYVVE